MRVYSQCTRRRSEIEAAVTDILRSECQGTDFRVSNTGSALLWPGSRAVTATQ